jgi:hypothetical protein
MNERSWRSSFQHSVWYLPVLNICYLTLIIPYPILKIERRMKREIKKRNRSHFWFYETLTLNFGKVWVFHYGEKWRTETFSAQPLWEEAITQVGEEWFDARTEMICQTFGIKRNARARKNGLVAKNKSEELLLWVAQKSVGLPKWVMVRNITYVDAQAAPSLIFTCATAVTQYFLANGQSRTDKRPRLICVGFGSKFRRHQGTSSLTGTLGL